MTLAQFDNRAVDALARAATRAANLVSPFYRAHPYRGRLWLSEVDMRVAISHEHRFLFNRLPKNANSTATTMLFALAQGGQAEVGEREAKRGFDRPLLQGRASVRAIEGYFKFCIVRDPYTRTLSAYLDKIVGRKRQATRPLRILSERLGTQAPTFEQFCEYLADGGLCDDNHWAPQCDGLVLAPGDFDHVARFEDLDAELAFLARRIFGRDRVDAGFYGPQRTQADKHLDRHYTPRAREIVADLFRPDFEAFGYAI